MYSQKYGYYNTKKQGKNDSKFEAGFAQDLALRKKAKDIKDYQEQVNIPLIVNPLQYLNPCGRYSLGFLLIIFIFLIVVIYSENQLYF